jgi:hypothetical protein
MSSFNVYSIMQLNSEISRSPGGHFAPPQSTLDHLEDKYDATNKLLGYIIKSNIWCPSKITDSIEKKFQSVVHHHENVVKSAQHHCLAPGALPCDIPDEILNHTLSVAKK